MSLYTALGTNTFPFIEITGLIDDNQQEHFFIDDIEGFKIVRSNRGFFGIFLEEPPSGENTDDWKASKEEAAYQLFAALDLAFIYVHDAGTRPVMRTEIASISIESDTGTGGSPLVRLFGDRTRLVKDDWNYASFRQKPISNELHLELVKNAIRMYKSDNWSVLLRLHNAYGLYFNHAWSASYIQSWSVIETWLFIMFKRLHAEQSLDGAIDLNDHRTWTPAVMSGILLVAERIEPAMEEAIRQCRRKRNDIVHNEVTPTKEECKEILNLCFQKCVFQFL
jgi:hypothetical protein